jgi:hypothetical protein
LRLKYQIQEIIELLGSVRHLFWWIETEMVWCTRWLIDVLIGVPQFAGTLEVIPKFTGVFTIVGVTD